MKTAFKAITLTWLVLLLAAVGLLLVACGDSGHTHQYAHWTVQRPATCTEEGEEIGTCSCGETKSRTIEPLGHLWKTATTKAATCEESGISLKSCTRAGCGESEEIVLPALGHDWADTRIITEPTCTEEGTMSALCKRCEQRFDSVSVPALGHDMVRDRLVKAANCTEEGEWSTKCSRGCGEKGTEKVAALGHDWESGYTVDTAPTFESAGSRSRHCARCGVSDPESVQSVPKLDANTEVEYEFRAVRTSGELITASGITFTVSDAAGKVVATGSPVGGIYSAKLKPATYTVRASCNNGYTAPAETVVQPGNLICNLVFRAQLRSGTVPVGTQLTAGSVLYDFTVTAVDGQTFTLSEVLRTKKMVVLNFWASWCGPCETEFPGLEEVWKEYQNDVAILALSVAEEDTAEAIGKYQREHGLTFQFARDENGLFRFFTTTGAVPTSVIVDCEGVAVAVLSGMQLKSVFRAYMAKYTSEPYWHAPEGRPASERRLEAILPERRRG